MSFRYASGIRKPGFNSLAAPTPDSYLYNLFGFGETFSGELGLGDTTRRSAPAQVGASYWTKVDVSYNHSHGIKSDGTLWGWGTGTYGQLGNGSASSSYSSPIQIGALTTWSDVSAGQYHTLALKTDGTMWGFGLNNQGQLGLGNLDQKNSPNQIGALTTWAVIAAGGDHSAAIKTDGTLWTWGQGQNGALGLGNETIYSSPKQVGNLTNWASLATDISRVVLAAKTDGTLWSWGENGDGQLGLGNRTKYSSPKQVGSLTNWLRVSGGLYGSAAVKTDGTLWTWGKNTYGQLGHGNTTSYSSPKQVGSLTTWSKVDRGSYATYAIKTDGTLWSWGNGGDGSLGLGNLTSYSSPKQIGASTTWSLVTGGSQSAMALG